MSTRTVSWRPVTSSEARPEGLRERKKRLMRQRLSDAATEMVLERGFDAVRVLDVATACGVSEKTVFNYFPTKESLILDRLDATMDSLRSALAEYELPPVEAALKILDSELADLLTWAAQQDDPADAQAKLRRFGAMIAATPSLRAYQSAQMDQLVSLAAQLLARRVGRRPGSPEALIAAIALLGLWRVQSEALAKHMNDTRSTRQVRRAVNAEVRRAAGLIDAGLGSFGAAHSS